MVEEIVCVVQKTTNSRSRFKNLMNFGDKIVCHLLIVMSYHFQLRKFKTKIWIFLVNSRVD